MKAEGLKGELFDVATFKWFEWLAYNLNRNDLFVTDAENHAIREIDFVNKDLVRTEGART